MLSAKANGIPVVMVKAWCAHCAEPLPIVNGQVNGWHEKGMLFCNEYCASALEDSKGEK